MRRSLPLLVLLLAATACSKAGPDRSAPPQPQSGGSNAAASYDLSGSAAPAAQASRDGGPDVGVTAAPGVAFNYNYEFSLPPTGISAVEEQHAQMCERLGIARCRITGMFYRVNNSHNVEGRLEFKLDPAIARIFGRDAGGIVVHEGGMLIESEITGTDVGPQIHAANRSIAEMQADLQRLETRLRAPNLDPDEKARLEEQAQQLRESIRAGSAQREEAEESLATTPMTFRYTSGEPTLGQSLEDSWQSFLDSGAILLRVLIALLPLALAIGIGAAIFLAIRRRWFPKKPPAVEAEASQAG
jgi:hypothetical protein